MADVTEKLVKKLTVCVDSGINQNFINTFGKNGSTIDDKWTRDGNTTHTFAIKFGGTVSVKATNQSDGSTTSYNVTLAAVHYDKKMFAPGEVRLVFSSDKNQQGMTFFSSLVRKVFLGGTFLVDVFGVKPEYEALEVCDISETVSIASNYYIHSIEVENISSTSSSLILKCYSFDKRLMAVRFSRVYTGLHFTHLCGDMVEFLLKNFRKDLVTVMGDEADVRLFEYPEYVLCDAATGKWDWRGENRLFMLAYGSKGKRASGNTAELFHPYLVQYNESFYDFMVRVAHRCGEFLYFENGKLNLGLPSKVWNIVSQRTKSAAKIKAIDDVEGDYYIAPLSTVPLCSYHEISSDDCSDTVDVKNFHQDYATGASVRDVSLSGLYYDIQNTSDEDLHYISEEDNDRDRQSPRWNWIFFNMLSMIFITEKPLNGLFIAVAYLAFDVTCQYGIIPRLTSDEFKAKYLGVRDSETKVPMVDEGGRETKEYAVRKIDGSKTRYLRIRSDGTETDTTTDKTKCDEVWYSTEVESSKAKNKPETIKVPMVDEEGGETGEYAAKRVGTKTEYLLIKSDGTETDVYPCKCDEGWYNTEVKNSKSKGKPETTMVPMVGEGSDETGEYAVRRVEGSKTEYLLIKSDGTETSTTAGGAECDEGWYNTEVENSKSKGKPETTMVPMVDEGGGETGEYAARRVGLETEYLLIKSDGTETDVYPCKYDEGWYKAEVEHSKAKGKPETTMVPMVDEGGNETGEYAVKRTEGSETEYLRIKSDGTETDIAKGASSCNAVWFDAELRKSKAAGVYYDGQKDYDTMRISSDVGIAISADQKEVTGVDDTANLCNSFFHFIETKEEDEERKSVTMNFSSNLADIYLGQFARIDDGIEDIYVVTRMYGSYVSDSNAVKISNYAEGVPVLGEKFEGMTNTVVPARGDISHSRQVSSMEAIVVKNEDPLRLGRVRVRYPWQSESDANISPWIRITVPFSGTPEFGGFTMTPELGEHVMLSYVAGNVERPYVEGSLYYRERVKKDDETGWLVNAPRIGGPEASKVSYRQIARTEYYSTSYKVRSILSGSGHGLIMSDLGDCNFFTSSVPFFKTLWTLVNVATGNGALHDADLSELGVTKGGGVTLTDGSYMCTVDLLPDKRAINITSSFGTVTIDAFTGISINAPNGDISIKGKNISLEAGNNIQIISGRNITPKRFKAPAGMAAGLFLGDMISRLSMMGARIGGVDITDICDVSFLRAVYEMAVTPVEGTLTIKSHRNVVVTAGRGKVEVPIDTMSRATTFHLKKSDNGRPKIEKSHFDDDEEKKRRTGFNFKALKDDIETACGVIDTFANEWKEKYERIDVFARSISDKWITREARDKYGEPSVLYDTLARKEHFLIKSQMYAYPLYAEDYKGDFGRYKQLLSDFPLLFTFNRAKLKEELQAKFREKRVDNSRNEIRDTAITVSLDNLSFNAPLIKVENGGAITVLGAIKKLEVGDCKKVPFKEIESWVDLFKKIIKRRVALAFICSISGEGKVHFLAMRKSGRINKAKIDSSLAFDKLRDYVNEDGLWQECIQRIVVDKMDNGGIMFGKGIASAISSSVKLGRFDDNGKFNCEWHKLVNRDGVAGPRAFLGGHARGNVFVSHEPGSFSLLDDEADWQKRYNFRELEVLTDYLKKL